MDFFQHFPKIPYTFTEYANGVPQQMSRTVPNMTVALQLLSLNDEKYSYVYYRISDEDRPDTVATKYYGSAKYVWVIMLANGFRDWYDWPLTDSQFIDYMKCKYETQDGLLDGDDASRTTVYQYRQILSDGSKVVVDATAYAALDTDEREVEYVFDHEKELNDDKRLIKFPTRDALAQIERELAQLLQGS